MSQRLSGKAYIAVIIVVAVILGLIAYSILTEKSGIVATTLRWSNLAPLPKNAKILSAKSEGGWTWRGYRVRFSASHEEIKEWLANSPGIKSALFAPPSNVTQVISTEVVKPHNTTTYFILDIIIGIGHAEVNIDKS